MSSEVTIKDFTSGETFNLPAETKCVWVSHCEKLRWTSQTSTAIDLEPSADNDGRLTIGGLELGDLAYVESQDTSEEPGKVVWWLSARIG